MADVAVAPPRFDMDMNEEEEKRLTAARNLANQQAREAEVEHKRPDMTNDRFKQLDTLLEQTSMYSQFLSEQMAEIKRETELEATENSNSRKRARPEEEGALGETRALLPLLTGGELREYQLKGVKWMISLYQNGLNGILADQMGLGKTVQCIGFLSHLRSKGINGPFIVLGPLSTLPNWLNEFQRFTPTIPALLYHGNKEERAEMRRTQLVPPRRGSAVDESFPVVITSYEIVIADIKHFQKHNFKYIIVDEGHRLKNFDCKLIRELRTLNTANKLLLTGTPLQNSLPELWSLLNFIMPEVFSNLDEFQSWFDFPVESLGDAQSDAKIIEDQRRSKVVSKLHSILQPFVLRRIKSDVETSLPKKKEIVLYAQMTAFQKKMNDALVAGKVGDIVPPEMAQLGIGGKRLSLRNMMMQLRKCANHPDLITGGLDGSTMLPTPEESREQCGKMALLDRMLTRLKAGGHKVLIFSQMARMLDILECHLSYLGYEPCRIDGSVTWQDRQLQMDDFNSNTDRFVFLLSTRAGGLGINLTGGDTAIIYDSDWNPHQDLQAMDRCHRIGQTRPVHVYRLATAHSVDGRMLHRASQKMMLERIVMKKGAFDAGLQDQKENLSMSENDLLQMLKQDVTQDGLAQSKDISDADLDRIMDRRDLLDDAPKDLEPVSRLGAGWEIIEAVDSSALLAKT